MFTLPLPLMNISPQADHKSVPMEEITIPRERLRSQTISSSRRRINRDSTIVLKSDRVQMYATQMKHQKEKDNEDTLGWSTSHSDEEKNIHDRSAGLILPIDGPGNKLSSMSIYSYGNSILNDIHSVEVSQSDLYLKSIRLIKKWWLVARQRIRFKKYTQGGRWNKKMADSVFALLLGYRVRCLLKLPILKKTRNAQLDIAQVLNDLLTKSEEHKKIGDISAFSASDKSLVQSLIKQLLVEKEKLHSLVFSNSSWRTFPSPGYWDLMGAFRNCQNVGRNGVPQLARTNSDTFSTPPRSKKVALSSQPRQAIISTPPYCNNSGPVGRDLSSSEKLRSSSSTLMENELSYTDMSSTKEGHMDNSAIHRNKSLLGRVKRRAPKSLKDILADKEKAASSHQVPPRMSADDRNVIPKVPAVEFDVVLDGLLLSPVRAAEPHTDSGKKAARAVLSVGAAYVEENSASAGPAVSPLSIRKRITNKPSIQLDVLSADRLMPAKKGSSGREGGAGPIPDRKPCLKVSLSLPVVNASTAEDLFSFKSQGQGYVLKNTDPPSSSQLKKIYQCSKDFEAVTLNPRWGSTFNIILPCNKQILQLILQANKAILGRLPMTADETLSERDYSLICRALLNWWSFGIINVEVLDGERFNEEIFIGHINLMLSGFMIGVKNQNELEMKGAYQLCKLLPSQRVTGSIKIHTYLHVPDIIFLSDIFRSISSSNAISELAVRKADENDLETSNVMDGSMDLLDISNSSEGNEQAIIKQGYISTSRNSKFKFSSHSEDSDVVVQNENSRTSTWSIQHASKRTQEKDAADSKPIRDSMAFDGSISRRMFIQDITKQLEGLSAVQNSTDDFLMLESFQRQLRDRERERERERRRISRFGNQSSSALVEEDERGRRNSTAASNKTELLSPSTARRSVSADAVSRAGHRLDKAEGAEEGLTRSARFMGNRGEEYRARREAAMQQRPKVVSVNQVEDCDVPEMQDSDVGGRDSPTQFVETEPSNNSANLSGPANLSYPQRIQVEGSADLSSDESDIEVVVIDTSKLQNSRQKKYSISNRLRRGGAGVMPLTLLKLKDRNSNIESVAVPDELDVTGTFRRHMSLEPLTAETTVTDSVHITNTTSNPQDSEMLSSGNTTRLSREDSRITMDADISSSTMNISSISNFSGTSAENSNIVNNSLPLSSTLAGSMKSNTARAILKEFLGNKQAQRPADNNKGPHSELPQQSSQPNHVEVRTRKRNHVHKALLELGSLEL